MALQPNLSSAEAPGSGFFAGNGALSTPIGLGSNGPLESLKKEKIHGGDYESCEAKATLPILCSGPLYSLHWVDGADQLLIVQDWYQTVVGKRWGVLR